MVFFSYLHFFSATIFCFLAIVVFTRNSRSLLNQVCALTLTCFCIWSFGVSFVENPFVSRQTAILFENIGSIGWLLFSSFYLWFVTIFVGKKRFFQSKTAVSFLFVIPLVLIERQWSVGLIHDHILQSFGWKGSWNTTPWTFIFFGYYSILVIVGFGLLIDFRRKTSDTFKKQQAGALIISGAIPFVLGTVQNVGFRQAHLYTVPAIGDVYVLVWAFGMVYAISKYRFLSFTPVVAAEKIIETMTDMLVLLDLKGVIVSVNNAALKILGYNPETLIGSNISLIFPAQYNQEDFLRRMIGHGSLKYPEFTLLTREGKEICVGMTSTLIHGAGIVIVAYDITLQKNARAAIEKARDELETMVQNRTKDLHSSNEALKKEIVERKKAEEDLRNSEDRSEGEKSQLEAQLQQAQKMEAIGQLAGGIAHDFNNMLGAIVGYADTLKLKFGDGNATLDKYVGRILDAAKIMADLTAKLLAFARKGKYEMAVINIHDTIQDVIKLIEHTFDRRIRIIQQLAASPSTVIGDPTQLENAILNLAVNARDAMPDGGDLTFATEVRDISRQEAAGYPYTVSPGPYLKLSVSDTGIGMDDSVKARIFEPFFTTKEKGKGTGLGLASVYGTIKSHNGHIEVETKPGAGTSFYTYLPLVDKPQQEKPIHSAGIYRGHGTVMLVDDEELVRDMAAEMLADMGYSVIACKDGEEAVEKYRANSRDINLVILDLIMPKGGGVVCLKNLQRINPMVKVVITSGYALDEEAKKIVDAGALAFLQKPFDTAALSRTVKKALR
jgi:PAS domain S-box-containing protein